jgi:hypothetical protein
MIDNDDEVELELDADPTEEEELLFSAYPGPRVFTLANEALTTFTGFLLQETDDSFLVGIAAKVIEMDGGKFEVLPFGEAPYFRLLKSATMSVMYLFGDLEKPYLEYLNTKGRQIYPELNEYMEDIDPTVYAPEPVVVNLEGDAIGLGSEESKDSKVIGMSDEELKNYLTKKFENGELVGVNRKKQ